MSLEEKQAAALRQRRRAFLDEVATIKKRQGGITKSQEQILEGVYELVWFIDPADATAYIEYRHRKHT